MKMKLKQAKRVVIGDEIDTTTGVRPVIRVDSTALMVDIYVSDPAAGPPWWMTRISFKPTDKVRYRKP